MMCGLHVYFTWIFHVYGWVSMAPGVGVGGGGGSAVTLEPLAYTRATVCDNIRWNSTRLYRFEAFAAHSSLTML